MKVACFCRCHQERIADVYEASGTSIFSVREEPAYEAYFTSDAIEAAVACLRCIDRHVPALLYTALPNDRERYIPDPTAWVDPETARKPK